MTKMEDNGREPLATLPVSSGTKCHYSQAGAACCWRTPYPIQWLQAEKQTKPTTHKTKHFSEKKLCGGEHLSTDTLEKKRKEGWTEAGNYTTKVYWPEQGLGKERCWNKCYSTKKISYV